MFQLLILLCTSVSVLADLPKEKCQATDSACLLRITQGMYSSMFSENELDPMHHDFIEGNLSMLKFNLSDITVRGFKDCKVERTNIDFAKVVFEIQLLCPRFSMNGKYDLNGSLFLLPVEGNGHYTIEAVKYRINIQMDVELKAKEGKTHIHVKSFKIDAEPLEGIVFKFDNLFNGNKELAEQVHKYVNENWKLVAKEVQGPVLKADIKKLIKAANKFFVKYAIEDFVTL